MISKTGIWSADEAMQSGYPRSEVLAQKLLQVFDQHMAILDFGCGDAFYVNFLRQHKYPAYGFDGYLPKDFPYIERWSGVEDHGAKVLNDKTDLAKVFYTPFEGQILSLEVGEHIPKEYEKTFIDNLCENCYSNSKIVLSWAIEGQGGIGHVNCRNNDYVIERFRERNFEINPYLTEFLRQGIEMSVRYFQDTLMVFQRIQ